MLILQSQHIADAAPVLSLEERLERDEIVHFASTPFPLPQGGDRAFLLQQQLAGRVHKNISYDPATGRATGFRRQSAIQTERLTQVLDEFSAGVTTWLARALPNYARSWQPDRASFRPVQEAGRALRLKARNDLLHVDAFPSRPTFGRRILRCFVNINPDQPRQWITSEPFAALLDLYGSRVGLPGQQRWKEWLRRLFRPRRSACDQFMLRLHDYLKADASFQKNCPRRHWTFAPGSAWLVFTDSVSHAALEGQYALEHSYFVSVESLHDPERAPIRLLEQRCGVAPGTFAV